MANELVKRMVKKDGSQRISFYREEYAENPRYNTDEPLHCEDWSRDYTIMSKDEHSTKSEDAAELLKVFIGDYGKHEKIMELLFNNGKHMNDGKCNGNDALVYERKNRLWRLYTYTRNQKWCDMGGFDCNKEAIHVDDVIDMLDFSTIDYIVEHCMTDGIKLGSYSFGYYGEVTFSDGADTSSEGICWLEKDEFLKYSGLSEEGWSSRSFKDIDWLTDEIESWTNNDVYGYIVEDCIKSKIHKEYTNVDKDDEDYEEEEWEESDSCWGFYGDIDEMIPYMFDNTGLKQEDFEEE